MGPLPNGSGRYMRQANRYSVGMLQWGRFRMEAEGSECRSCGCTRSASMGPLPNGSGRTVEIVHRVIAEMLQWGRFRMEAEGNMAVTFV